MMKSKLSLMVSGCGRACALAAAWGLCTAVAAQGGTVATGGTAMSGNYSLGISLGQVAASAAVSGGQRLNEGLQQGFSIEVERIAGAEGSPSVEIFPNPTAGAVTLRRADGQPSAMVELYAADGRRIERQAWQGSEMQFELTGLAAGSRGAGGGPTRSAARPSAARTRASFLMFL